MDHASTDVLTAGLAHVRMAPTGDGRVELIVRRPARDAREVVEEAALDPVDGLVGDTWNTRPSSKTADNSPHPDMQLTLMGSRAAALVAGSIQRWPLAGDQLYVDLDLSTDNLPVGTCLEIGTAIVEVTDQPHTGCAKFSARFGTDALGFVNSPEGRAMRLRGMNTKVVVAGSVRTGDHVRKVAATGGPNQPRTSTT